MLTTLLLLTLGGPPDAPPDDPTLQAPATQRNPFAKRIEFKLPNAPARIENGGDHWCPKCGSGEWTTQYRQANGWHSHKCGKCGTEFWHPNPAPQPTRRFRFVATNGDGCST